MALSNTQYKGEIQKVTTKFNNLLKENKNKQITDFHYYHSIEDDDYFIVEINNTTKLYIYGFLRISYNNKLILTSWDKHFTKKYKKMNDKMYFSKESFHNSLIVSNLGNLQLYLNSPIENINFSETGDLSISLKNELCIEIIVDCLYQNYVYYKYLSNNNQRFSLIFTNNVLQIHENK